MSSETPARREDAGEEERVVEETLPRMAVADSWLEQLRVAGQLTGDLKAANADGVRPNQIVLFVPPLSPSQRRSLGNLLAAAAALPGGGSAPPGALDSAAAFAADGTVSFLRFLELKNQRGKLTSANDIYPKQAEMAAMLHRCEKSNEHLWNIGLVTHLTLGTYYLALADRTPDKIEAYQHCHRGMEYLRKAAAEPNIAKAVQKTILAVSKQAKEPKFTAELERTLAGPK